MPRCIGIRSHAVRTGWQHGKINSSQGQASMNPQVSVIFPVGERQAYLAEAIESVLNQTLVDFEFLIILDGVSDAVLGIVEAYRDERIRVIRLPLNLGISNARNAGLVSARAPCIALMDSDDVALPQRLQRQHDWLQAHPDVTVLGSNATKFYEDGRRVPMIYPQTDGEIKARLLLVDSALLNPTAMFRADFIQRHGLRYDASFPRDQDHRLFVDMMLRGAVFHGLQEPLLHYRRHAHNATRDRTGVDAEKSRIREPLLHRYFPELTGHEVQALLKGMHEQVQMSLDEVCGFVAAANKALRETRVFHGEDRSELRRILQRYLARMHRALQPR